MKFQGISFTEAHWKTKTEAEFIAHESHHGLTVDQLKEAYSLMIPKPLKKVVDNPPVNTGAVEKPAK